MREKFIAIPETLGGTQHLQQCHETQDADPLPCVGWLYHQLGVGQNLALRMMVITGEIDANVEIDGAQHERIEDTLPRAQGARA